MLHGIVDLGPVLIVHLPAVGLQLFSKRFAQLPRDCSGVIGTHIVCSPRRSSAILLPVLCCRDAEQIRLDAVQDAKGLSVAIVQPARWVRTGAGFVGRPAEGWWLELRLRLWLSRASASLAGFPAGGPGVVSRSSFDAGGERPRKASRGLVLQRCSERVTWPALLPHDFAALLSSVVAPRTRPMQSSSRYRI